MKPIVDVIGEVITALKPTFDTLTSRAGQVVTFTNSTKVTHKLFVGERIRVKDGSTDSGWHYGAVTSITNDFIFVCTFTGLTDNSIGIPEVILNYHYGPIAEIISTFVEITSVAILKLEQFPAICLVFPIKERHPNDEYVYFAPLTFIVVTDSKQEYKTKDRYTYSFKPILYPLWDLFHKQMQLVNILSLEQLEYEKTDTPYTLDDNKAANFNDFIDALKIENLEVKINETESCIN